VVEVRGEVVWPREDFLRFNEARTGAGASTFANPRNATAGTLKQLDPRQVAGRGLVFVAHGFGRVAPLAARSQSELFERFARWGVPVSPYSFVADGIEDVIGRLSACGAGRGDLPYETDGLVIKVDALAQRAVLGATNRYPRWCIAYKFAAERAESVLKQVDYQVGKLGTITPRAVMEPMQLSGTTVRHASLHNFDQVDRLDIRIGDTVVVEKAGEIIPQVVGVVKDRRPKDARRIERPVRCPVCDGDVEQDDGGVYVRCVNPTCPAQRKERLIHFAARNQMDIDGAGRVLVERLADECVDGKPLLGDFADFYHLHRHRDRLVGLAFVKTLGEKRADGLLAALEASRRQPLSAALAALDWAVDDAVVGCLARHYASIADVAAASVGELCKTAGLPRDAATVVFEYLHPRDRACLKTRLLAYVRRNAVIKQVGPALIDRLVDEGLVERFASLYDLRGRRDRLAALTFTETLGAKTVEHLLAGIERSKGRPLARLLAALNIRHVGAGTAEVLADHFGSLEKLRVAEEDALCEVDGVGPEVARSVRQFFGRDAGRSVVDRLVAAGVETTQPRRHRAGGTPLAGKTVVVTGTLAGMHRKDAEALVKRLGGKTASTVSRKTDLVVHGAAPGSKLAKARALGVQTMSDAEFTAFVGRHEPTQ
ncbi:MAG: NAD-dependent DNA ligase LigA, partial [Phycisphaerae bacterium]